MSFTFVEEPSRTYMLHVTGEYAETEPVRVVALVKAWLHAEPEKQVFAIGAAESRS